MPINYQGLQILFHNISIETAVNIIDSEVEICKTIHSVLYYHQFAENSEEIKKLRYFLGSFSVEVIGYLNNTLNSTRNMLSPLDSKYVINIYWNTEIMLKIFCETFYSNIS